MSIDWATLSDGELAALSVAGRDAAFAEIVRRHRDAVFRLARGSVGDAEAALDLSQETFVAAHGALSRYDAGRSMRTWLLAIALNKCRDWARKRAVRRFLTFASPLDGEAETVADDQVPLDDALGDRRELKRVTQAIADLPSALRETLVLRTIEGLSQAETAATLSISEKSVETRLFRARAKLLQRLKRR